MTGWQRYDFDKGVASGAAVDRPEPDGGRGARLDHGVGPERRRHHRLYRIPSHDAEKECRDRPGRGEELLLHGRDLQKLDLLCLSLVDPQSLREAFRIFDKNKSGYIEAREIILLTTTMGEAS